MDRRTYLKHSLQSVVLLTCLVKLPAEAAWLPLQQNLNALPAFLDTLIPEDMTPSASQLGLHQALIRHAQGVENYTRLLELGCQWLDGQSQMQHRVKFDALPPMRQEGIVVMLEASAKDSIPKMFFDRVLSDLMGLYYAQPASWPGLGIDSPPQPKGYPDYVKPLHRKTRG